MDTSSVDTSSVVSSTTGIANARVGDSESPPPGVCPAWIFTTGVDGASSSGTFGAGASG
ncbi:hypothetical protein [Gordonia iterans]